MQLVWENTTAREGDLPGSRGLFARGGPYGLCVLIAVIVAAAIVTGRPAETVVAGVGLMLAVWIALRPQRGVLLAVALIPLDGLRLPLGIGGAVASWKEALALLTAACALLSVRKVAERTRPDWFWWLVALVAVAAVWFGIHQSKSAIWGLKLDFIYLTLTYAAWRCPLTAKDRDRLVSILMGVGVLTAAYGVVQQLLGHARLHDLGYEYNSVLRFNGGFLRSVSTFALPFSFGFFMMMVI